MKKPVIGIMPLIDTQKESYWMLPGYMDGLRQAGALPLMLPLTSDETELQQIVDICDGFLFTGGQDVSPSLYHAPLSEQCGECCPARDKMEAGLFQIAYEKDKPILGICRGIQIINVLLGGTLYQDLPTEHPSETQHHQSPPYDLPCHRVSIKTDSALYELLQKDSLLVNSYHHQAIKELSPHLTAMAYSPDGLVEAVSAPDKKFLWALQWHPEFSYLSDENSRTIFKQFVEKTM